MSIKFSVLNLIPRFDGETEAEALQRATDLISYLEDFGYERYWVAEHHNFPGTLGAATELIVQHLLQHSSTIRVGAGGVMVPNHNALQIAERYGTLEVLYPGRVDLGLGRAPGTDKKTAELIYHGEPSDERFKEIIAALGNYFDDPSDEIEVKAFPGQGTHVPMYILGSSLPSAYIAAELGLPYSFAGHFAPYYLEEAISIYRNNFKPSRYLDEPYFIIGVIGVAAETKEEADLLNTTLQQSTIQMASGQTGLQPLPSQDFFDSLTSAEKLLIELRSGIKLFGTKEEVARNWKEIKEKFQPDEVIIVSYIPTLEQLVTSYRIIAEVIKESN